MKFKSVPGTFDVMKIGYVMNWVIFLMCNLQTRNQYLLPLTKMKFDERLSGVYGGCKQVTLPWIESNADSQSRKSSLSIYHNIWKNYKNLINSCFLPIYMETNGAKYVPFFLFYHFFIITRKNNPKTQSIWNIFIWNNF